MAIQDQLQEHNNSLEEGHGSRDANKTMDSLERYFANKNELNEYWW